MAPVAAATQTKWYEASATPASIGAGATVAATFTITNDPTSQQSLGSANVTAPTGLSFGGTVTMDTGTASLSGGTLQLRNLNLAPGSSATASFSLTAQCGSSGGSWGVVAKQSNDFNGPPGNAFTMLGNAPSTSVTGTCTLRFISQPADTNSGAVITTSAFDPTGGPIVVEADAGDGTPVSGVAVTMAVASGPSASLGGTVSVTTGFDGQAAFGDLTLGTSGTYTLGASATGFTGATSDGFVIADSGVVCQPGQPCSTTDTNKDTSTNVSTNGGTDGGILWINLTAPTSNVACSGYSGHGSVSTVNVTTNQPATVNLTLIKAISGNQGVSSFQVCYSSNIGFTDRFGNAVAPGGFGLLPDCSNQTPVAPCVVSRNRSQSSSNVIITFLVPAGDPIFRG